MREVLLLTLAVAVFVLGIGAVAELLRLVFSAVALDPRAATWLLKKRGIRPETAEAFGVHTEGRDLVFPYPEGLLKRRYSTDSGNPFGLEKEGRQFVWRNAEGGPAGAGQVPFLPPDFEPRERILLVEGETDAMAAYQAIPAALRDKVTVVGLSGTGSWAAVVKSGWLERVFGPAKRVFVIFDRDDPYENPDGAKSVERAWQAIRADLGRKARRVVLPQGINDLSEFFLQYDWVALQVLLTAAAEPKRNYPRLDLSQEAPPTDWLVEDLLVSSEVTVVSADAGVGKSFFSMALALAVAGGDPTFLHLPVVKHGSVLYVDEEQSAQLVHQRLKAMGLEERHRQNLEYLWYAGVDLANEPERLLEDVQEIEPSLVVIDSLSRVALGVEENSNTEMSALFRKGIVPIARDTGAAVLVLHHAPSDNAGKPRGASAIKAAADQVISIVAAQNRSGVTTGVLNIFPSKPRRRTKLLQAKIEGDIEQDGWVRVLPATEEEPF